MTCRMGRLRNVLQRPSASNPALQVVFQCYRSLILLLRVASVSAANGLAAYWIGDDLPNGAPPKRVGETLSQPSCFASSIPMLPRRDFVPERSFSFGCEWAGRLLVWG